MLLQPDLGYHPVLKIPAGSTNLIVEEDSDYILALRYSEEARLISSHCCELILIETLIVFLKLKYSIDLNETKNNEQVFN